MLDLISTPIPAATAADLNAKVQQLITALKPFEINLASCAEQGALLGREAFARIISKIAAANAACLPHEHDAAALEARLSTDAQLEELQLSVMDLLEAVQEIQAANGIDIVQQADACAVALQASRAGNSSLDAAMSEADEWNRRFAYAAALC
jgi:hypothetical protein